MSFKTYLETYPTNPSDDPKTSEEIKKFKGDKEEYMKFIEKATDNQLKKISKDGNVSFNSWLRWKNNSNV